MLVIKDKQKFIRGIFIIVITLMIVIWLIHAIISGIIFLFTKREDKPIKEMETTVANVVEEEPVAPASTVPENSVINDWNLKLVNKDNSVSRTYVPELEELDDGVMFDKRAISYLRNMINAMYKSKLSGFWVASAYRSYEKQEELFNNKVNYYLKQGNTKEKAESLAQKVVQRPEMSEHNLGLAADFNTVTNEFETTKAFKWLQENADDYGFILRYPKDKEEITGITYESWHWRYVGKEHAKVINEKGYCLEEYIDYLKGKIDI